MTANARSLAEVLGDLYARTPKGIKLGLDAMNAACTRFGHPERGLSVVHVAGTNGKGSVSAMVEAIARTSGLRTGLYTSPHLSRFAERIRMGGVPIDDDRLRAVLDDVLVREPDLTFFEVATLTALLAFREARVDLAVLEVGLGGRLDATNVVRGDREHVSAVTRIALDHQDKLGSTLEEIAREKAGIAKQTAPMFLGPMPEHVLFEIEVFARSRGAIPLRATERPEAVALAQRAKLSLDGAHQRDNALVACAIAQWLGIPDETIERGLGETRWPGRLETIALADGPVLFDAAHNPDGAHALFAALANEQRPLALVFGALADKDWATMLDVLAPLTPRRMYTSPRGRAATEPALLAARHAGSTFERAAQAYAAARASVGPEGLVVVAGSISLVGELRADLRHEKRDPPVAL